MSTYKITQRSRYLNRTLASRGKLVKDYVITKDGEYFADIPKEFTAQDRHDYLKYLQGKISFAKMEFPQREMKQRSRNPAKKKAAPKKKTTAIVRGSNSSRPKAKVYLVRAGTKRTMGRYTSLAAAKVGAQEIADRLGIQVRIDVE